MMPLLEQEEIYEKPAYDDKIICGICRQKINLKKEFAEFIHFNKKSDIKSTAFYHVQCFRDRMSGGAELRNMQAQAKRILNMAEEKMS